MQDWSFLRAVRELWGPSGGHAAHTGHIGSAHGVVTRVRRVVPLIAALAVAALSAPAFAQVVDPSTDPPTSTEPPSTSEPAPSTEPATSTEPVTDPSSTTEPGSDPSTSTSEPPTSTTEPPLPDLSELLIPRPEFGALSGHQRALVDDLQRATYSYALRRLALVTTERQVKDANAVLAGVRRRERCDRQRDPRARPGRWRRRPRRGARAEASPRCHRASPRAARIDAQDGSAALNDQADQQRRAVVAALADRATAESGLQDELGPDAVRANPDDVTATLTKAQADQPDATDVGGLTWPIPGAAMASPFGLRNDPLSTGAGFHPGVDVTAPSGSEVHAAAAGRVVRAGDCGGYGNCVVIDHGNSVATLYGHLSQIDVSAGDTVDANDVIGLVGSTGWSTGAHLHFEVRVRGLPIDPMLALGDTH